MTKTVLLKLGGSVITDKSGECAINTSRLESIACSIARHHGLKLIIVHGAGSCGHPEAKRHHLDKGLDPNDISGISVTHLAVRRLNDAVVDALRRGGVEAVGLHPFGACTAENGRLATFDCRPLKLLMRHGITPVMHGDVVMDKVRGACILSGDQLVAALPEYVQVDRIGLATNVPGVLKEGLVVPHIDRTSVSSLDIAGSDVTDVTGGMKGKIDELLYAAENGIESHIFHISRLDDFLGEHPHGGTTVSCPPRV